MTALKDILFGKSKKPEQIIRENQRALKKVIRELEREQHKIEADEKKLIVEIKKAAKNGQDDAVKIMARDLVRNRAFGKKFLVMKANIQAVSLKLTTLKSMTAMTRAMKEVGGALKMMNKQMNLPTLQKVLMQFEKESAIMELKDEIMNETIEGVFEEEGDEEDMDKIVNQVFDELGIEMNSKLTSLGSPGNLEIKKLENSSKINISAPVGGIDEDDLEARLANLKKI